VKENIVRSVTSREPYCSCSDEPLLYEMGNQGLLLMDLNHEIGGMNRRPDETALDYWNRLHADADFINTRKDYSFPEF